MWFTLSQPPNQPIRRPSGASARRHIRAIAGTLSVLAVAVFATACNRVDSDRDLESAASNSARFDWPQDPSHPTLTLEIGVARSGNAGRDEASGQRTIVIELMPELAPVTVAHVIELAKDHYYDGTTFHRVIPGFMIQGGDPNSRDRDPNNDGNGNPKMHIADEFGDAPFLRGVVGMGNLGRSNSTGSQFFIMHADHRSLDGRYTAIGRVISGMEVVDAITEVSIDKIGRWGPRDRPIENVLMKRVAIQERAVSPKQITTGNAALGQDDADS
jgi:peptidyl-prolyl cis-trans isomerase B (cyclophilin B)